jgi:hypothetical protein
MDIKELDKKQLILLTLLITFVVSIATGIVTVSLMNQMPKSVPQTINNVIQRTIEKVTTVPAVTPTSDNSVVSQTSAKDNTSSLLGTGDILVDIYLKNTTKNIPVVVGSTTIEAPKAIGQGIIISDVGLILVDSSLINDTDSYKVILDKTDFNAFVLKKFSNGFTILKISTITDKATNNTTTKTDTPTTSTNTNSTPTQ